MCDIEGGESRYALGGLRLLVHAFLWMEEVEVVREESPGPRLPHYKPIAININIPTSKSYSSDPASGSKINGSASMPGALAVEGGTVI